MVKIEKIIIIIIMAKVLVFGFLMCRQKNSLMTRHLYLIYNI
jgi:hypothetical protein